MLRDHSGAWAWILNVHNHGDFEIISSCIENQSKAVELIVISEGYASKFSDVDEWYHKERTKSTNVYEFYNVLSIFWENGIAYRTCIGRVQKSTWDVQKIDWINVTLG